MMKQILRDYGLTLVLFTVFVLPPVVYLTANTYWWLFDGNTLQLEKISGAGSMLVPTGIITLTVGLVQHEAATKRYRKKSD